MKHNKMNLSPLIGNLIGDAYGQPFEFLKSRYSLKKTYGIEQTNIKHYIDSKNRKEFKAGFITDDGSMALVTLYCLMKYKNDDCFSNDFKKELMNKYCDWYFNGFFSSVPLNNIDIGAITFSTLNRWLDYDNEEDYKEFFKNQNVNNLYRTSTLSGNGTIMKQSSVSAFMFNKLINKIGKDDLYSSLMDLLNNYNGNNLTTNSLSDLFYKSNKLSVEINRLTHSSLLNDFLVEILNMLILFNLIRQEILDNKLKENIASSDIFIFDKNQYFLRCFLFIKYYVYKKLNELYNSNNLKEDIENYDYISIELSSIFDGLSYSHKHNMGLLNKIKNFLKENKNNNLKITPPFFLNVENNYSNLKPTGYSLDTLKNSIYCFYHSDNFFDGLINTVDLLGDADTNGAVYGQIAASFYGLSHIENINNGFLISGLDKRIFDWLDLIFEE